MQGRSLPGRSSTQRSDVRCVNGDGPRCGCGQPSRLHVTYPGGDVFFCADCAIQAVIDRKTKTEQDDQGPPGDPCYAQEMRREHIYHEDYLRGPQRWCPDCEASP